VAKRTSPKAGTLLIADDHELARAGLRALLAREHNLEVLAEATTGAEAVYLACSLRPDVVLMDVRMPDMDGLAATRAIKQTCPGIAVLIVTMHADPDYLFEALKAGAAGYVLKDTTRRDLAEAVQRVLAGETLLEPRLAEQLLRRLAGESRDDVAVPAESLTAREREVLQLVAQGKTNPEIADALAVSVATVKVQVERIIDKLGVSDRTQAAVRGVELGLVTSAAARRRANQAAPD
jgi:DNA-binding NarL/FixJ family response regulator